MYLDSIHRDIERGNIEEALERSSNLNQDEQIILQNEIYEKKGEYQKILTNLGRINPDLVSSPYVIFGQKYQTAVVSFRMGEFDLTKRKITTLLEEIEGTNLEYTGYWEISSLNLLASLYALEDNYEESEIYFERCIDRIESIGYNEKLGTIFSNYAALETFRGNYRRGEDLAIKGLEIYKKQNWDRFIAISMGNIAETYILQGRLEDAKQILEEANEIFQQYEPFDGLTDNYMNLGIIHFYYNEISRALNYFKQANNIALKNQNPIYLSNTYYYLVMISLDRGKKEHAEKYLKQFKRMVKSTSMENLEMRYNLTNAVFKYRTQQIEDAMEIFRNYTNIKMENALRLQFLYHNVLAHLDLIKEGKDSDDNLSKIKLLTDQIMEIGNAMNSSIIICRYHVLQSQIYLIRGKVEDFFKELDTAERIAKENDLLQLVKEITNMRNKLRRATLGASESISVNKRIQDSLLDYYLQQMIKLNVSS